MSALTKRQKIGLTALSLLVAGAVVAVVMLYIQPEALDEITHDDPERSGIQSPEDPWGIDWAHWQEVNPDVIGWIVVDDTDIDYPILQAHEDDPEFYLDHDVNKKKTRVGVPYVDYRCEGLEDEAVWIYGHHTRYHNMFTELAQFRKKSYAQSHKIHILKPNPADLSRTIELNLTTSATRIVNAAAEKTQMTGFSSRQQLMDWYETEYQKCPVKLSLQKESQSVIALVTCSYTTYRNERTVVYCLQENPV